MPKSWRKVCEGYYGAECSIDGCSAPMFKRGWCNKHYLRWYRHGHPMGGGIARGLPLEWLKSHVSYKGDDCLKWPFARSQGYANINYLGVNTNASRVMCILAHGEPSRPSLQAAHICGSGHRGCVNPRHLVWATPAENSGHRMAHGTHIRGSLSGRAKLTEMHVKDIRKRLASGEPQREIALAYSVSKACIHQIATGKSWWWLE